MSDDLPPAPVPVLSPSLVASLRERTQEILSYLVRANSPTTFFTESDILADFRRATSDGDATFATFHQHVPLSAYEHYLPFVSRLLAQPCNASTIENLMAPGFPEFIAHSAGTSSGGSKYFPKYRHPKHMSVSTSRTVQASNPTNKTGGKNCIVYSLRYRQLIEALGEDGFRLRMPVCLMSAGTVRMHNNLHVNKDPIIQEMKMPNQSSPLGVSFVANYKSFLFLHALFALYEPKVELINTMFSTIFRDFCRVIDEQWDAFVECIESGAVPDLESVGDLRRKLQRYLSPNPERAAELRELRQNAQSPGWFAKIWPGLRYVIANSSGPFQTVIPEIRHYIGPDVELHSLGITCSEAFLALAYDSRDPSLYKVVGSDDIVEFLPLDAPEEAKYVTQTWSVQVGKKYDVVLTTRDGFWRYRLGDVVEVVGFDPRDGQPIIHYIERRGIYIRLANEIVTGQELLDAINAMSDALGVVSEFCVAPDFRESIPRYGFFVELHGELGASPSAVSAQLHAHLQQHNENYLRDTQAGKIASPSVRILRQGTFGEYRDWKIQLTGQGAGQIKVPAVAWDEETRNWLAARVVREL